MKAAIISIAVFLLMKMAYNFFGVVGNVYWNVIFYVPLYAMIVMLLRYIYLQAVRVERQFLLVVMVYFGCLIAVNLVCLFDSSLYKTLIINLNKFGIPAITLVGGLLLIKILQIKKP